MLNALHPYSEIEIIQVISGSVCTYIQVGILNLLHSQSHKRQNSVILYISPLCTLLTETQTSTTNEDDNNRREFKFTICNNPCSVYLILINGLLGFHCLHQSTLVICDSELFVHSNNWIWYSSILP